MAQATADVMNEAREKILGRVKAALAPLKQRAPPPEWDAELIAPRRLQPVAADPWETFATRMRAAHGIALANRGELIALMKKNGWQRGYCDPALAGGFAEFAAEGIAFETNFDRAKVDEYQFGVTAAAGAIAETGTLILSDRGTSSRLAALAPWVHIAVLRRAQIQPDFVSAIAAFGDDPNIIWVTGPSKTADIEGILIEGVHGPGVQIALLID